ncbi:Uncharacterized protein OBRU01_02263 [Operophtera brumata]|uniref:Uncharacterized protein n=1 Tax=Operophtera brumata TaxID=104452 RepID=A0A0L7LSQ7_OPEBR|nr:Uncharacterized protein OBRU01_02263 [Operophtera brumata]
MLRDEEALSDIDRALTLTAGTRSRARAQALCQRGVVELNPYAALCNQMLSQVLKGEDIKL